MEEFAKSTVKSDYAKAIKVKVNKTLIAAFINAFGHKDPDREAVTDNKGKILPDSDLTDYENVPYLDDIHNYFAREFLPYVSDAYVNETFIDEKDRQIGYEINFNRFFYQYQPPRKLHEIDEELKQTEIDIAALLAEVARE